MKTKKILIIIPLLLFHFALNAQDPSFSQFYFNQTFFNPGYTAFHGGTNFSATYRRQWVNIPSKFETLFFNFDSDISSIPGLGGIGINAFKDIAGNGLLSSTGAEIMISNRFPTILSKRYSYFEKFYIQPGISIGFNQKELDWSKFIFGDQLDGVYGLVKPNSEFTPPSDNSIIFPDFKIGVVFKYGEGPKKNNEIYKNWDVRLGFAMHHVFEPNQSFLGQNSRLPRKYVSHLNFNIALNREADMIFAPCIVWENQQTMNTILGGFNFLWKNFFIGGWYRGFENSDALILNLGFIAGNDYNYSNKFKIYYSYDLTISGLTNRTTGGSHEISVSYYFDSSLNQWLKLKNNKRVRKDKIPCPAPNIKTF